MGASVQLVGIVCVCIVAVVAIVFGRRLGVNSRVGDVLWDRADDTRRNPSTPEGD